MKRLSKDSDLWYDIWRDKGGWRFKIERRGGKWATWEGQGFDTRDAAEAMLKERLKGVEGE